MLNIITVKAMLNIIKVKVILTLELAYLIKVEVFCMLLKQGSFLIKVNV